MNLIEVKMSVFSAPQGYHLAHAISRDKCFKVGLPKLFNETFDLAEKLRSENLEIGECYPTGNVYSLCVKDSSYDAPDRDSLLDCLARMREHMEADKVRKLAIPKICCGKMGLEWDDVKSMIDFTFSDMEVEIIVCVQ